MDMGMVAAVVIWVPRLRVVYLVRRMERMAWAILYLCVRARG